MYRHLTAALLLAVAAMGCQASESASGSFTAGQSCEALNSFAKHTNPGNVQLKAGTAYTIREINKADYDWVRVEVPGAEPPLRWVPRQCGTAALGEKQAQASRGAEGGGQVCSLPNQEDSYVLAITWEPGFCEHARFKGKKPECEAMESGKLQIKTLSLHGLWPNKKECGTNYGGCKGPDLELSKDTIEKISPWMPNFYYERSFGTYEWDKHGKCQSLPADQYFMKAVSAVRVVNDSEVGKIVLANEGKSIRVTDFFDRIKASYGDKVANSITLICTQHKYLQEIRVSLPTDFSTDRDLTQMVGNAKSAGARQQGCDDEIYIESPNKN